MGLNAGRMDREIVVQKAPIVQSASGEETFDWANSDVQMIWAEWLPAGTTEVWRAQQRLTSRVDGMFRIHYADLDPLPTPNDTRILFDGRIFDIMPYVEVGRGQALEIPVVARGD